MHTGLKVSFIVQQMNNINLKVKFSKKREGRGGEGEKEREGKGLSIYYVRHMAYNK